MLVGARAVQGVFGALLAPAALSLLTTTFTDRGRSARRAFGIYGAIAGGGASLGLLLGGVLTEYLSWRCAMYVNLASPPAAIGAIVAAVAHERQPVRPRIDIPGVLTASGGLFAVVYGFIHAETTSWGNPVTVAFLAVGGRAARRLRGDPAARAAPAAAAAGRARPQPRRLVPGRSRSPRPACSACSCS